MRQLQRITHSVGCLQGWEALSRLLAVNKSCLMTRQLVTQVRSKVTQVRSKATYSIVKPGKVKASRPVPNHIPKPSYVNSPWFSFQPKAPKSVEIKTEDQIAKLKEACVLARSILNNAGELVRPGVTTEELNCIVHEDCLKHNAYPSPLLYKGFPKSVCTSVNNVACHGIPDDRPLQDGDVINIDVTVYYKGYHGDTSATFLVGNVDENGRRLVDIARDCRDQAITVCGPGVPLCTIGEVIESCAESNGFTVIPQFCGHGIGEYFHGPPDIFHFDNDDDGEYMRPGMTFTIEPIISEGEMFVHVLSDGWTAVSSDDSRSAQFEHTILITKDGVEILTL